MSKNQKRFPVAIVGATGAVGKALLDVIAELRFPYSDLYLLASARSAGKTIVYAGTTYTIQDVEQFNFSQCAIAFFSAGAAVSAVHAPRAAQAGCIVVDNTSHFRRDDDIPLIVPEVNIHMLDQVLNYNIIANPNCSTIQMVTALKPIHDVATLKRINVATYQAVSGSGYQAIDELNAQLHKYSAGGKLGLDDAKVYPQPIALNAIPHIDVFLENGYTKEEMKMVWETQKIFDSTDIKVNPTCVRIPVVYGHSEAIHIETVNHVSVTQVRDLLSNAPGVKVVDDPANNQYPTALIHSAGNNDVWIGRIREDISCQNGLCLWVVSDNIRKGAAANSVQIGQALNAAGFI